MASSPITSWQIERKNVEAVTDFTVLDSKITMDSDCSHEIKRCLLLERKAITNLNSVKKQRDHFANKGLYSQSYGFFSSHVWRVGPQERLSTKELMLLNCGVAKDS